MSQQISVSNDDSLKSNSEQDPTLVKTSNTKAIMKGKHSTLMISVKDYAYDEDEDLHYGVINYSQYLTDEENYNDEYDDYDYEYDDETAHHQHSHHPLQDGGIKRNTLINIPKNYYFEDGPPWKEDPDLKTPLIKDDSRNEFEFSIASSDEIHGKAIALFDFTPENDNEVALKEGQIIWISYRHGQGWLVAEDSNTGETGLVPEEYVQLVNDLEYVEDEPRRFLPDIISDDHQHHHHHNQQSQQTSKDEEDDSDWVDEDEDEDEDEAVEAVDKKEEELDIGKLDIK